VMLHRSGSFSLDDFRQAVIDTCTSGEEHLVVSVPCRCHGHCSLSRPVWIRFHQLVCCAALGIFLQLMRFRLDLCCGVLLKCCRLNLCCGALWCAVVGAGELHPQGLQSNR
jgi:hypothetical protein